FDLAARPLHSGERDEATQDLVRSPEHHEDARVPKKALPRMRAPVAARAGDLLGLVCDAPERLGAEHLRDRALDGVIALRAVGDAGRQINHALEREYFGGHARDLVAHETELGDLAPERLALADAVDRELDQSLRDADARRREREPRLRQY